MATVYNTSHIKTKRKLPLAQRMGVYNPGKEASKILALSPLKPLSPLDSSKGDNTLSRINFIWFHAIVASFTILQLFV